MGYRCSGCPILPAYRTSSDAIGLRLSDSSHISDNQLRNRTTLVRFLPLIGHPAMQSDHACPILPAYRTSSYAIGLRLSDFPCLSDVQLRNRTTLIRFLPLIGHSVTQSDYACPILPIYRTSVRIPHKNKDCLQMRQPLFSTFLSMQLIAYAVFYIAGLVLKIRE